MNKKTKNIAITGLMAAIIAVIAVWQIPLPFGVPLTFQVFAVALGGYALGRARGTLSTVLYVFIGLVGIPVFTGFIGGLSVLAGPSGGFIAGFIPLAFFCGLGSKKKALSALSIGFLGLLSCHLLGVLWFCISARSDVLSSAVAVSLPYILKDVVLLVAAYFISRPLKKSVKL